MADNGTAHEPERKAGPPRFEVSDQGHVIARIEEANGSWTALNLGEREAAMEAMADFLGQQDFEA